MNLRLRLLLLLAFGLISHWPSRCSAADSPSTYYTKKRQTDLLDAPRSREAPVARVEFREKLEVVERDGPWLKVRTRADTKTVMGWVYEGNVAEKQPPKGADLDFLPTNASATSASVAARPLNEVAKSYAQSKGKEAAAADIEWLEKRSATMTETRVVEHLAARKQGEFE